MSFAPHYINGEIVVGGSARAGTIRMNGPIPVPMAFHNFGGREKFRFNDDHVHEGVRFYTRLKTLSSRWPTGGIDGTQFTTQTYA